MRGDAGDDSRARGLFASWDSGEPNNDSNEDCDEVRTNARWNDGLCDGAKPFVCERY